MIHIFWRVGGCDVEDKTYPVAAAVRAQVRGRGDAAAEPEDDIQDVEDQGDDGVEGDGVVERGRDKVEEGEHAEDGDEEVVVDDAVVTVVPLVDHVAGEGHDEEGPEEL